VAMHIGKHSMFCFLHHLSAGCAAISQALKKSQTQVPSGMKLVKQLCCIISNAVTETNWRIHLSTKRIQIQTQFKT
jgi:hypothetical protein